MEFDYQISEKVALDWVIKNLPQFLFPDLSKKKERIQKPMIGAIATFEKKPVGLILATDDNTGKNYRIHSFLVHPDYRKGGVGSALIKNLESYLVGKNGSKIDLYYRAHWPSGPYLEKLLLRQGWSSPVEDLIIVRGEAEKVNKLFMHDRLELPEQYSIEPLLHISPQDRKYITARKQKDDWYLDYLDPFLQPETICGAASLVIRKDGSIVGWVISHLVAPDLNEFTALFIDPENRPYKLAHLLMREAITRQQRAGIKHFLITSKSKNYVMSRFLLRHAEETGVFITRSLHSVKSLV